MPKHYTPNQSLVRIKSKKVFVIHKCSYYLRAKKKVSKNISHNKLSRYKLHYIYREFIVDFFNVSLDSLPDNSSGLKFIGQSAYIMGLCLTYYVNLKLSLKETSQAMKEIHNVYVSHTTVANYAKTAVIMIKPFTDRFDFEPSNSLSADKTYIKLPDKLTFVADGYRAYPLAAQQFERNNIDHKFKIIQVIGLKNVDDVSIKFRPLKQMIERLNRTRDRIN